LLHTTIPGMVATHRQRRVSVSALIYSTRTAWMHADVSAHALIAPLYLWHIRDTESTARPQRTGRYDATCRHCFIRPVCYPSTLSSVRMHVCVTMQLMFTTVACVSAVSTRGRHRLSSSSSSSSSRRRVVSLAAGSTQRAPTDQLQCTRVAYCMCVAATQSCCWIRPRRRRRLIDRLSAICHPLTHSLVLTQRVYVTTYVITYLRYKCLNSVCYVNLRFPHLKVKLKLAYIIVHSKA